jgi:hypothetical protein
MKIESVDVIPYERALVFATLRDELVQLVPYLPNIEIIEEREREELGGGSIRVLNWWKAESDVPKVARAVIKPDMLHWKDHATWHEERWSCEWRLETSFFPDRVTCRGTNTYRVVGAKETELAIRGELEIDAKNIKGVPSLLAGTVGAAVERFVVALITPNFKTLNRGLVQYLDGKR